MLDNVASFIAEFLKCQERTWMQHKHGFCEFIETRILDILEFPETHILGYRGATNRNLPIGFAYWAYWTRTIGRAMQKMKIGTNGWMLLGI